MDRRRDFDSFLRQRLPYRVSIFDALIREERWVDFLRFAGRRPAQQHRCETDAPYL
jgi:hypothetical protein